VGYTDIKSFLSAIKDLEIKSIRAGIKTVYVDDSYSLSYGIVSALVFYDDRVEIHYTIEKTNSDRKLKDLIQKAAFDIGLNSSSFELKMGSFYDV